MTTREFETGATRDTEDGKMDFEGHLSPLAMEAFVAYMHKHRYMKDGSIRDSDNWQRGMPLTVYAKSLWRHFFAFWKVHRGWASEDELLDDLCGIWFNTQGYIHEYLKAKRDEK